MPYEITRANLSNPGEFDTEVVESLGSGKRKVEKGQITTRERTVTDEWQVIRVKEVEEAPEEEPVVEEVEAVEDGNLIKAGQ